MPAALRTPRGRMSPAVQARRLPSCPLSCPALSPIHVTSIIVTRPQGLLCYDVCTPHRTFPRSACCMRGGAFSFSESLLHLCAAAFARYGHGAWCLLGAEMDHQCKCSDQTSNA
eukprot:scpid38473/ scgid32923/ 